MSPALRSLQLRVPWPPDCPVQRLRPWLISQLEQHGQPLRWAITEVDVAADGSRCLKLEAVVQ